MKCIKHIFGLVIGLFLIAIPVSAHAQGQLALDSTGGSSGFGQVLGIDGQPISTDHYTITIIGGTSTDSSSWSTISTITTGFFSFEPGYIDQGTVSVTGTAPNVFYYQILVYDNNTGSSYANATIRGSSAVSQVTLIAAPTPPAQINTFANFQLAAVPEPTTLALAGMGGIAMLMRRRKKLAA